MLLPWIKLSRHVWLSCDERSQIEFKRFMFDVAGWCVWSTVLLFFLAMSAIPIYVYLVGQQGVVDLELIITLLLFKAAFEMIRGVAIGRAVFVCHEIDLSFLSHFI